MESVSMRKGCLTFVRGDKGTDNGHVAAMQNFLTDKNSFIYGRSSGNQRIEMFWNFLRKQCCQLWIDYLGVLADEGLFNGGFLDQNLIQFCCLDLLQHDLDEMVRTWNVHHIRPSKKHNCPHGRPVVMYTLPASYGTRTYRHQVEQEQIEACQDECSFREQRKCGEDIYELCTLYIEENGWVAPETVGDALSLYSKLRNAIQQDL